MGLTQSYWYTYQQQMGILTNTQKKKLGAIPLFRDMSPEYSGLAPETVKQIQNHMGRGIEITTMNTNELMPVTNVESFDIPVNGNTSGKITVDYYTTTAGFTIVPAELIDNAVDPQTDYNAKMDRALRSMAYNLEAYLIAVIEANKTQVFTGAIPGFSFAADTLTVTNAAQKDRFFDRMEDLWDENFGMPNPRFLTSFGSTELKNYMAKYDKFNAEYQNDQNTPQYYKSHFLAKGANNIFTGYYVDKGAMTIIDNIKVPFRDGYEVAGKTFTRSNRNVPYLDGEVMIYMEDATADASGYNAKTSESRMTYLSKIRIIHRIGLVKSYLNNAATDQSKILKIVGTVA